MNKENLIHHLIFSICLDVILPAAIITVLYAIFKIFIKVPYPYESVFATGDALLIGIIYTFNCSINIYYEDYCENIKTKINFAFIPSIFLGCIVAIFYGFIKIYFIQHDLMQDMKINNTFTLISNFSLCYVFASGITLILFKVYYCVMKLKNDIHE